MRTLAFGGLAVIASAIALGACSDSGDLRRSAPTGPLASGARIAEGTRIHAQGGGTVTVRTAQGVVARALPGWTAVGIVRNGIAPDEGAGSPLGVLAITDPPRRFLPPGGERVIRKWLDADANRIALVFEFAADGAPVHRTRLYVNGMLRMTATYQWTAARGGWTLQSAARRLYRDGQLVAVLTGNADATEPVAARAFAPDAFAHVALGAARLLAPDDAQAQVFSGACRKEELEYIAAEAALTAAIIALEKSPGNPIAWALFVAASARAAQAEMALWLCQENERERNGGGTGGGGGGGWNCSTDPWMLNCDDPPETL